ncbi:MAG: TadE family protein [Pseudomonadota bacterium]
MTFATVAYAVTLTIGRLARWSSGQIDRIEAGLGLPEHRREAGVSTVEFALMMPVFLTIFISSFETSVLLIRQVLLERATDLAVRELRLDSNNSITSAFLRHKICDRTIILPDCMDNMLIELTEIERNDPDPTNNFVLPTTEQPCVDRVNSVTPPRSFTTNRRGKLVLLRACFAVDPFMPGVAIATKLVVDEDKNTIRMVASTAFLVEE